MNLSSNGDCMPEWLTKLEPSDWIAIIALIVAVGSLFVTWRSAVGQRRTESDREMLNQLILTLERSYNAISPIDQPSAPNRDRRLGWVTAARHLLAYKALKKNLKTELYKTLCNEHEEFWRHQFYVLLQEITSHAFFQSENGGESIAPTSAAVVHAFSKWPKDRDDPLDDISFEDIVRENNLFSVLCHHFHTYIKRNFPELYRRSCYAHGEE